MKISCQKREGGSVLLITLIFAGALVAFLASYLVLISDDHSVVLRSQTWNSALTVAEAGVEEAMSQLNTGLNNTPPKSDFSDNGWGSSGGKFGPMARTLTNGNYTVTLAVTGNVATIQSKGYATVQGTGSKASRTVVVQAQYLPAFNVALGAVNNINMNGNSVASDSWNSHTNSESSNGLYNGYSGYNGNVASQNGIVNIGNHIIQGNLYLGPNATYTSGNNQVTGTIYDDYNVQFPDAVLPTQDASGNSISWLFAPVNAGNYTFTTSGYYVVNNTRNISVAPGVSVILDVKVTSFNPSAIDIGGGTTNSGTLKMYQESGTVTLGGNSQGGGIGNRPENFIYYGLPGVTSMTLSGTSTYIGAIYAPEADLTLNGGGNSNDLEGAAIVKSVTLNGHYNFHYDEALAHYGPTRGYVPISWQEL